MIERLIASLLVTLLLELSYALVWQVRGRDLLVIIWMNILTNPLVVLINYFTASAGFVISTLLPELAAIAAETIILKRFSKNIHFPILLAICINVFSYICGVFISYLLL